jgi:hypothetical protein
MATRHLQPYYADELLEDPTAGFPAERGPALGDIEQPTAAPAVPDVSKMPMDGRMPGWLEGQDADTQNFFQNIYNTEEDPGAYIAGLESQYRDAAASKGMLTDATSANVLPFLDDFARTGELKGGVRWAGEGDTGVMQGPGQQMGEDPFSQLVTGGLSDLIENKGALGGPLNSELETTIMGLLNPQRDEERYRLRFEQAREGMEKARRTQTNAARGALASRNLLSEPGIPQGSEIGAIRRIEENIAPEFAGAVRDIHLSELDRQDANRLAGVSSASNLLGQQGDRYLSALGEGTNRQEALASIALATLDRNMAWNQFLAEFGLKREQVMAELESGRFDRLFGLLQLFQQYANGLRGGFVIEED